MDQQFKNGDVVIDRVGFAGQIVGITWVDGDERLYRVDNGLTVITAPQSTLRFADVTITYTDPGIIAWLAERNITSRVVADPNESDIEKKLVIGPLAEHLAPAAAAVLIVSVPVQPDRWPEVTPERLNAAGAYLVKSYIVKP